MALKAARPSTPPAMMVGPWLALRSLPLTPNKAGVRGSMPVMPQDRKSRKGDNRGKPSVEIEFYPSIRFGRCSVPASVSTLCRSLNAQKRGRSGGGGRSRGDFVKWNENRGKMPAMDCDKRPPPTSLGSGRWRRRGLQTSEVFLLQIKICKRLL